MNNEYVYIIENENGCYIKDLDYDYTPSYYTKKINEAKKFTIENAKEVIRINIIMGKTTIFNNAIIRNIETMKSDDCDYYREIKSIQKKYKEQGRESVISDGQIYHTIIKSQTDIEKLMYMFCEPYFENIIFENKFPFYAQITKYNDNYYKIISDENAPYNGFGIENELEFFENLVIKLKVMKTELNELMEDND